MSKVARRSNPPSSRNATPDRCLRFTRGDGILELEMIERNDRAETFQAEVRLQIRLRTAGLLAQTELVCGKQQFRAFSTTLARSRVFQGAVTRLAGVDKSRAALALSQRHAALPVTMSVYGPSRDPRASFVLQDWELDSGDLVRLSAWCAAALGPERSETPTVAAENLDAGARASASRAGP